jgi:uroporphyrinogen-III synthase
MPRVLITRPAHDAAPWVADLQARGVDAQALPLIDIRASRHPKALAALDAARARLTDYRAVMFVSGNAAQHFLDKNTTEVLASSCSKATKTRAWTPGPGTTQALLARGVPAHCIDAPAADAAQFDSEALWQQVASQIQPGDMVLIVRGGAPGDVPGPGSGRDWLATQLRAAGALVDFVAAYERHAPQLSPEQLMLAHHSATDGSLWLFSSSEALAHLRQALPTQDWSQARALATHPRIAAAAHAAGFGVVIECKPSFEDVVASIESTP